MEKKTARDKDKTNKQGFLCLEKKRNKKTNLLFNVLFDIRGIERASALGSVDDFRHELGVGD